jgi:hypothetical protein
MLSETQRRQKELEEGARKSTFLTLLDALESIKLPPRSPRPHALATRCITVRTNPLHSIVGALVHAQRLPDPCVHILRTNSSKRTTSLDTKVARRRARLAARDERVVADAVVVEAVEGEDFPAPWVLRAPVADGPAAACRGRVGTRVALEGAEGAGIGVFAALPSVLLVVRVLLASLEGWAGGTAFDVRGAREVVLSRSC